MLVDAHCHINTLADYLKEQTLDAGVNSGKLQLQEVTDMSGMRKMDNYIFIDVSIDSASALQSLQLSRNYNFIYSCLGFHPFADEESGAVIKKYQELIKTNSKIVAIGEVGLDYKARRNFKQQKDILDKFIKLSKEFNFPIMIHNRWLDNSIFDILDEHFSDYHQVIFHCFCQNLSFLKRITAKGGYVSFSLNVLRKKINIDQALKAVPLNNCLLETDSPYMRVYGKCSYPLDINKVYAYTARIKNISLDNLVSSVASNVKIIFGKSVCCS